MCVENKAEGLNGPARIGWVQFSKTGATLYYGGKEFRSLKGGYKANYFDVASCDQYWISGCHKNGAETGSTKAIYRSTSTKTSESSIGPRFGTSPQSSPKSLRNRPRKMIRKLKSGQFRIYSRHTDPKTGKRRNLGTFESKEAAQKHEREIQYFKRH
jgi:hypothetical protein